MSKLLQDEGLLSDWKKQLERDIETMKAQSNIGGVRTVSPATHVNFYVLVFDIIVFYVSYEFMKQDKDILLYFMIALVAAIFLHFSIFRWFVGYVFFRLWNMWHYLHWLGNFPNST